MPTSQSDFFSIRSICFEMADRVRPEVVIWTNHPIVHGEEALWDDCRLLREVDWVLNESPDLNLIQWLGSQCGPKTRIVQCLAGWANHDAEAALATLDPRMDLYGFCRVDVNTALPSPQASEQDYKNITTLAAMYRRMSAEASTASTVEAELLN